MPANGDALTWQQQRQRQRPRRQASPQKGPEPQRWLYVLRLEGDRFWIGTAAAGELDGVLAAHWAGTAAGWTATHQPTEVICVRPIRPGRGLADLRAERARLAKTHADAQIRNDHSWYECESAPATADSDPETPPGFAPRCSRCGREGHTTGRCGARWHADGRDLTCARCGRAAHSTDNCYAGYHLDGTYLGARHQPSR
jgi:hypothetical protein